MYIYSEAGPICLECIQEEPSIFDVDDTARALMVLAKAIRSANTNIENLSIAMSRLNNRHDEPRYVSKNQVYLPHSFLRNLNDLN
jgi:hypothetical protein